MSGGGRGARVQPEIALHVIPAKAHCCPVKNFPGSKKVELPIFWSNIRLLRLDFTRKATLMFRSSSFGDILKLLPRQKIASFVKKRRSDFRARCFFTWDHLVAMLGGQLADIDSLRDVENLFDRHKSHHYHLHCKGVKRSTLADANNVRDYRVFADIAQALMAMDGGKNKKTKQLLSVLDSSPIQLCGRGHDWATETRTRTYNQGLKLHLMLTPRNGAIDYANITDMNVNDITDARDMTLESDRIYVFDKGYLDFNWWHEICETGSHFVTRIKKNTAYKVLETRPLADDEDENIIKDMVIELTNKTPRGGKINRLAGRRLRLIEIEHPGGKKDSPFYIISDMMEATGSEIADYYKQRWSIELLFKWLKQNLKIKRFMGESKNAILIQIFTAIIAYMLVRLYRKLLANSFTGRLKDLLVSLKTSLFQRPEDHSRRRTEPPDIQPMLLA